MRTRRFAHAANAAMIESPINQPQARQPHMYIGVTCADDHAVVAIEQQIAVETIGPGLHREEKAEQR